MPKISVIVPVYKVEKFLPKCLESLINQTLKDIEIICINDGSPDNSLKILEEYAKKDSRIKIINQKNAGPSVARNNGMSAASGEYIGFVDSDDWIDLDFYEKLYAAAKKYDADIAAAGIIKSKRFKGNINYLNFETIECTEDTYKKYILCNIPDKCYIWNKIYRTSEMKKQNLQFVPDIYYEDMPFSCEALLYLKKLVVVPGTFYYYNRLNSNSIVKTTSKSKKKKSDSDYADKKVFEIFDKNNINIEHHYDLKKYKLFGITLLKIKYFKTRRECKLFNIIKFNLPNRRKNTLIDK